MATCRASFLDPHESWGHYGWETDPHDLLESEEEHLFEELPLEDVHQHCTELLRAAVVPALDCVQLPSVLSLLILSYLHLDLVLSVVWCGVLCSGVQIQMQLCIHACIHTDDAACLSQATTCVVAARHHATLSDK